MFRKNTPVSISPCFISQTFSRWQRPVEFSGQLWVRIITTTCTENDWWHSRNSTFDYFTLTLMHVGVKRHDPYSDKSYKNTSAHVWPYFYTIGKRRSNTTSSIHSPSYLTVVLFYGRMYIQWHLLYDVMSNVPPHMFLSAFSELLNNSG